MDYYKQLDKMVERFNWATCDGLKQAGLEYWTYKNMGSYISLYFKNILINNYNVNKDLMYVESDTKYKAEKYDSDRDMKRFLTYI